jgi:peptidoglycan/LPS O-acetylase OafA/YrhL
MTYLPQLDGLRAIAVMMVMAYHFIPGIDRAAPLGSIGVRLFFVLSGFLITRILLDARSLPLAPAMRMFYIRRSLRILPLFYAVLLLAALINIGPVRETFLWHAGYLTNAYLYLRGDWHGSISHLWSLAVEEQFYLLWPLMVLRTPLRRLPYVVAAMVCISPLLRLAIGGPMNSVLPVSCLDALGAGALLALPQTAAAMAAIGRTAGLPLLLAALAAQRLLPASTAIEIVLDSSVALVAAWVVHGAAIGFSGVAGTALAARPLRYVGTISYGVYMLHGFMPYVLGRYISGFVAMWWPVKAALLVTCTLAAASFSWHLFERPILLLKERWAQRDQPAPAEPLAA